MIEELARPASDADVRELALLLLDAVASGASVGFLDTLSVEEAGGARRLHGRGEDGLPHRARELRELLLRRGRIELNVLRAQRRRANDDQKSCEM